MAADDAPYGPYRGTVQSWHDGDTCHMDLDLGFGLILALSCRCYGMNAIELHDPGGLAARDAAEAFVPPGSVVVVFSHGWDKYGGRFLGQIALPKGGGDFAEAMISGGHGKPYFGKGPKPT